MTAECSAAVFAAASDWTVDDVEDPLFHSFLHPVLPWHVVSFQPNDDELMMTDHHFLLVPQKKNFGSAAVAVDSAASCQVPVTPEST